MRVLARKKIKVGILYAVLFVCSVFSGISLFFTDLLQTDNDFFFVLLLPVLLVVSLINVIRFFRTPINVIHYDSENFKLCFPKGESVYLSDIISVNCKNAKNKYGKQSWGTLIITTTYETYKFHFIAECESVVCEIDLLRR